MTVASNPDASGSRPDSTPLRGRGRRAPCCSVTACVIGATTAVLDDLEQTLQVLVPVLPRLVTIVGSVACGRARTGSARRYRRIRSLTVVVAAGALLAGGMRPARRAGRGRRPPHAGHARSTGDCHDDGPAVDADRRRRTAALDDHRRRRHDAPTSVPGALSRSTSVGDRRYPRLGSADIDVDHYDVALTYDDASGVADGRHRQCPGTSCNATDQIALDTAGPHVTRCHRRRRRR